MNCTCLTQPTIDTTLGFIAADDGMLWIYGPTCTIHHEPAVSPIWHPRIGWLDRDRETATVDETVAALIEA